jgi:hypothetical protein
VEREDATDTVDPERYAEDTEDAPRDVSPENIVLPEED